MDIEREKRKERTLSEKETKEKKLELERRAEQGKEEEARRTSFENPSSRKVRKTVSFAWFFPCFGAPKT